MQKLLIALTALLMMNLAQAAPKKRPVIMLTGYWNPTNEMVRKFSRSLKKNPGGWVGRNWEKRGYDIQSYFPEFPAGSGNVGVGDFQVEHKDTRADFNRIVHRVRPIAIISFGLGDGPWEVEVNAPPTIGKGEILAATLPAKEIVQAVNDAGYLSAWADWTGDAGDYLCGFLSRLGALYQKRHESPSDPHRVIAQGFIHVGGGQAPEAYEASLDATLRALTAHLDREIGSKNLFLQSRR